MIITRLIGGLGNQLFQYALGRRLSHKHRVELKLDISGFEEYKLHAYSLGRFAIAATIASPDDLRPYRTTLAGRASRKIQRMLPISMRRWIVEPHIRFAPEILDAGANVYLDGYWQSEKYFKDIAAVLREDIRVITPLGGTDTAVASSIAIAPSAAVHVRRGDYLTNTTHGTCNIDYYQAGMRRILEYEPAVRFFVFSDDPSWARTAFSGNTRVTVVAHNKADRNYEDFRLMSMCRHHIIANSTYSWWSAWLSPDPAKIVVAPRTWFQDAAFDATDIVPEAWVRI